MELGGGGGGAVVVPERQGGKEAGQETGRRQPRAAADSMKFRVSARAPHGVAALLLVGGAALAGAAVVAWRHTRRGKRDHRQPAKREEVSDGGVVEEGTAGVTSPEIDRPDDKVQSNASPRKIDQPDEDLRAEDDKTKIGSTNGLDDVGVTVEGIQEVHDDAEIVVDESVRCSEQVHKTDLDLEKRSTEAPMHYDVVSEHVEKFDQDSNTVLPEITTRDFAAEKGDENAMMKNDDTDENNDDDDSTENDVENDQDPTRNHMESDSASEDDLKKEIAQTDDEDVEASDGRFHSPSRPSSILDEQSVHSDDGAQDAEPMEKENSPTAQLMVHPADELSDDAAMNTEEETAEAKPGEGTVCDEDAHHQHQQAQQNATAEPPAGLAVEPALLSSVVKPTAEKKTELPGWVETGMKVEQDYTSNGEHRGMIRNGGGGGGAKPGGGGGAAGAVAVVDRSWSSSITAVLALMLALAVGVTVVARLLYATPPRATMLVEMGLQ